MISQVLLVALMVSAQGNIASARTGYSKCLGAFTRAQVKAGVAADAFQANVANACKAEEAAFRSASVATDVAAKIARATAEQNATEEIGYIHENAVETFKDSLEAPKPK
jgi:FlaG/FlaF family flagellin (archaellin)